MMKTIVTAYVILSVIIIIVIINSLVISHNIDVILEKLHGAPDTSEALDTYEDILENYIERQKYLGLTVSHDDLTNIEREFYEILGAAKAGDDDTLKIAKSRLTGALTHLKRLCGINFDSILLGSIKQKSSYFHGTHSCALSCRSPQADFRMKVYCIAP